MDVSDGLAGDLAKMMRGKRRQRRGRRSASVPLSAAARRARCGRPGPSRPVADRRGRLRDSLRRAGGRARAVSIVPCAASGHRLTAHRQGGGGRRAADIPFGGRGASIRDGVPSAISDAARLIAGRRRRTVREAYPEGIRCPFCGSDRKSCLRFSQKSISVPAASRRREAGCGRAGSAVLPVSINRHLHQGRTMTLTPDHFGRPACRSPMACGPSTT